jgi:membrane protease YdiL (CAAX protease family)
MDMLDRKPLLWFLAIAFGLAWILFILPIRFGAPTAPLRQTLTLVFWSAAMWAPGLAAIVATRFAAGKPLATLNLGRLGEKRAYLWAWLLPPLLSIATGLLTWLFRAGRLDLEFTFLQEALAQTPGGEALPVALIAGIQVLAALTIGPLFNTIFALGEELGWRGFLLPRLLPLGQWRAILFSGTIWGVWHAPVILQGHNYPTRPAAGVFMMIVFCVLAGTIFSWLYLRTRSPWAPALAHGSLNASAGLPLLFITGVDISIGGTLTSLIGWIPLALFVGWLIWSRRLPVKENDLKDAGLEARPAIVSRETSDLIRSTERIDSD